LGWPKTLGVESMKNAELMAWSEIAEEQQRLKGSS
jgi:hypothetical protein